MEAAVFETPAIPLNRTDNRFPLLRHNRPFSASVQPVGAEAAARLPVEEAEVSAVADREWVHADQKDHSCRLQEVEPVVASYIHRASTTRHVALFPTQKLILSVYFCQKHQHT